MKAIKTSLERKLIEAHTTILGGIEQMKRGCELIVECLDEDREFTATFMKARGVIPDYMDLIENVGRGHSHPKLLMVPLGVAKSLSRAPLPVQERLLETGVEIVQQSGNQFKRVLKPVQSLSNWEASLAVDYSGNISPDKQIEVLKARTMRQTFRPPPYSLDGDALLVRENTRIPFDDLEVLYTRAMKAHAEKVRLLEAGIKKRQVVRA